MKAIVLDTLSPRPDYLAAIAEWEQADHIEYVEHMGDYLTKGALPGDEFDELIKLEAKNFVLDNGHLYRRVQNGGIQNGGNSVTAPYLEWFFRGDFVQRMHNEYGHLSYRG